MPGPAPTNNVGGHSQFKWVTVSDQTISRAAPTTWLSSSSDVLRSRGTSTKTGRRLMSHRAALATFMISMWMLILSAPLTAQQVSDTLFTPPVGSPAFKEGTGPIVHIDGGHQNFHTMEGRYLPFARILQHDGYVVRSRHARFVRTDLDSSRILVISNALAKENQDDWNLPTPSAFDSAEIAAVRSWVHDGGSLWLIADHMPFPGAAGELAAEFGILMGNGFALDPRTEDGRMRFARSDGTLADHPITRGRNPSERIDSVVSFTGQAFRLEVAGDNLMTLGRTTTLFMPEVAWQFSKLTPRISASGMLQGAAIRFGKGRVAVFGEAAMFSAQLAGPNRVPVGMNDLTAPQNPQFLLNVVHWLSGLL
jgi:hypothetical protein